MILTICPNPSIDCTIELDNFRVGMLNRIQNKVETYSGKALNVAIGVARLKENECTATGFMFENQAKLFEQTLDREGVIRDFIYNKGDTRVNYKIIDKKGMLTEINDKGETVTREKQIELIEKVKLLSKSCSIAVMSGSLPSGVSPEFYNEVLKEIPTNVKVIVDAEKENLEFAMQNPLYMLKPNLRELEDFALEPIRTKRDMVRCACKLIDRGVENVLVSMGADGAILTNGTKHYFCKSASVAINSTVGAGDSMVAAVCAGLERGDNMPELLRSAVSAGTASIATSGTNLFYRDKYEEIYAKVFAEELVL